MEEFNYIIGSSNGGGGGSINSNNYYSNKVKNGVIKTKKDNDNRSF